jgi:hypothetical protein
LLRLKPEEAIMMSATIKKLINTAMLRQLQDCRLIVEQSGDVKVYLLKASLQRVILLTLFGFILAFFLLCAYTLQLGYNNDALINTISDLDPIKPVEKASEAMLASADMPILLAVQEPISTQAMNPEYQPAVVSGEDDKRLMIFESNINIQAR